MTIDNETYEELFEKEIKPKMRKDIIEYNKTHEIQKCVICGDSLGLYGGWRNQEYKDDIQCSTCLSSKHSRDLLPSDPW